MNEIGNGSKVSPMRLLPHQFAFIETCFDSASNRVIDLRADVGMGKSAALVALADRLLRERPMARVLLLVPAALRSQFIRTLSEVNIRSLLLDRYLFRELLDSAGNGEFWPRGITVVASLDFAKLPDIRDSLAAIRWDLVVIDESHLLRGARTEAVKQIGESAERVVLAGIPGIELTEVFPGMDVTRVDWRRDQIVDYDGTPVGAAPRPMLREVVFSLSPAELSLVETVETFCRTVGADNAPQGWTAHLLHRSVESSPAALERVLRGLVERLDVSDDVRASLEIGDENLTADRVGELINPLDEKNVIEIANRALQDIEAVGDDSKLRAFSDLLRRLTNVKTSSRRICVLTDYLSTLYYLAAEIEDHGLVCQLMHGGMPDEERKEALTQFVSTGSILVATAATMIEGIDFPDVTDLVLYDVPRSKVALQIVLARFDRFDRQSRLDVHVLTPSNSANGPAAESLLHSMNC